MMQGCVGFSTRRGSSCFGSMGCIALFNDTDFDCMGVKGGAGADRASATDLGGPGLGAKSAIGSGWETPVETL